MIKRLFLQIHLWLGLLSGLCVFVIAITGALSVFEDEISSLNSYQHVEVRKAPFLPPSKIEQSAEKIMSGKKADYLHYQGVNKPVEVSFYGYAPTYYYKVFINPYTGEVLKVKNMNRDFFRFIMQGHYSLWLPPQIGQPLVVAFMLIFVVVLLSGLFIRIPNRLSKLKNLLVIRWRKGVRFFKVSYDLHVVGGIYVLLFAIIFVVTGLVFGFPLFADGLHKMLGGTKSLHFNVAVPKTEIGHVDTLISPRAEDKVWFKMIEEYPAAGSISITPARDSATLIAASATEADGKNWKTDYCYFNPATLKEVKSENIYGRFSDANFADKTLRMNYDIHTGSIFGLPGKIIAFLMSLFIASFPVTGFVIWWKKRRKKLLLK